MSQLPEPRNLGEILKWYCGECCREWKEDPQLLRCPDCDFRIIPYTLEDRLWMIAERDRDDVK